MSGEYITVEVEVDSVSAAVGSDGIAAVVSASEVAAVVTQLAVVSVVDVDAVVAVVDEDVVHAVVVGQQGPQGPPGQYTFAFSWGDATPVSLMTVLAGQMVLGVTLSLDVPFNGVGAALSVGDADDDGSLLDANMVDPTIIGAFQNSPCIRFVDDTEIILTIVPGTGASQGSGVVSLYLE